MTEIDDRLHDQAVTQEASPPGNSRHVDINTTEALPATRGSGREVRTQQPFLAGLGSSDAAAADPASTRVYPVPVSLSNGGAAFAEQRRFFGYRRSCRPMFRSVAAILAAQGRFLD